MGKGNNPTRPGSRLTERSQSRWANPLSSTVGSSRRMISSRSPPRTSHEQLSEKQLTQLPKTHQSLACESTCKSARELARTFAERGDLVSLTALLQVDRACRDVTKSVDESGRTLLSHAAGNGHLAMTSYLAVEVFGDQRIFPQFFSWYHDWSVLRTRDNWGRTALSRAAGNGHPEVTEFLLDRGGPLHFITDQDNQGRTPLSWAAGNGHLDVDKVLVEGMRASLATVDDNGWTPLNWASKNGHRHVHEFLLSSILADTNLADHSCPQGSSWMTANGNEKGLLYILLHDNDGVFAQALRDRRISICGVLPSSHSQTTLATPRAFVLPLVAERGWSDLVVATLRIDDGKAGGWNPWGRKKFENGSAGISAVSLAARNDHFSTLTLLLNDSLKFAGDGRGGLGGLGSWWTTVFRPILISGNAQLLDRLRDHEIFSAPRSLSQMISRYRRLGEDGEPDNACLCRFCQRILQQLLSQLEYSFDMNVSIQQDLGQVGNQIVHCAPVSLMEILHHRCDLCRFLLQEGGDILQGKFAGDGLALDWDLDNNARLVLSIGDSGAVNAVPKYRFYCPKGNRKHPETMSTRTTDNLTTDFKDCVDIITRWLESCIRDHRSCSNRDLDRQLPKRVLKLDFNGREHIKLMECNGAERGKYVALSHCWGDPEHMNEAKTTINNYKGRLDSIPSSDLPRTFQDAAQLCWALGIKYLWIDSICIVQDDPRDWQHQSTKMTAIYEDAFITFAATASSGCREGLKFIYPRPRYFPPLFVGAIADWEGLRQQPLYKRGWTLQEMELSRRIVHFAADQLYLVCRSQRESGHQEYLGPGMALSQLGPAGGDTERRLWWGWVEDYSNRTLTIPEDKLPAFAGLTKKFQQLTGAHPAVGLWMEDIHYGLLWRPATPRSKYDPLPGIPSWSWASFNGAVLRPSEKFPEHNPTADIHPRDGLNLRWEGEDLTSRISMGILHVRTRLRWFRDRGEYASLFKLDVSFDYELPDDEYPGEPFAFLEISTGHLFAFEQWQFLVVQRPDATSQRYTRVGVGSVYKAMEWDTFLADCFDGCPVEDVFST